MLLLCGATAYLVGLYVDAHDRRSNPPIKIEQKVCYIIYLIQEGFRRGGLTPACGSAHARNGGEKYKTRGRAKANVLPRGVLKYIFIRKFKRNDNKYYDYARTMLFCL